MDRRYPEIKKGFGFGCMRLRNLKSERLGLVKKWAMCPRARDFFARQGVFSQQYFVYCKKKQRGLAEKDPSFGYVDVF